MKNLSIFPNLQKENADKIIEKILSFLSHKDIRVRIPIELQPDLAGIPKEYFRDAAEILETSDMAISIGGDGTFLAASRFFAQKTIPILGINLGRLGFLTEFSYDQAIDKMEDIIQGKFSVTRRMRLEAEWEIDGHRETCTVLNDVVIAKGGKSRAIPIYLAVNDEYFCRYRSDGVIFATPTGSTAYNLSLFGPILHPTSESLIVTPISPHTLAIRPVVLPVSATVECQIEEIDPVHDDDTFLTFDGQVSLQVKRGDKVWIRRAPESVDIISNDDHSFYGTLRSKLGWVG